MEEIIKQIVQIDSVAVNWKKNFQEALKQKKEAYEKEIFDYEEDTLKKAKASADETYEQIVKLGMSRHQLDEEKCKKIALVAQNRYLQVEPTLLDEVFNELFGMEG